MRAIIGGLPRLRGAVETLAWAWHFTEEKKYAEHAAKLLRVWFLDADTRMNPNMNFAQAIPGITAGRGVGTIDFASLPQLVVAAELLVPSRAWTDVDHAALKAWFGELVDWLVASRNGKDAAGASNNIATWCDVQVVGYALFAGKVEIARERLEAAKTRRIAAQISPDGRQKEELKRTRSLDYSTGNLAGLLQLAALGKSCDIDLLNYKTEDGRSIRAGARLSDAVCRRDEEMAAQADHAGAAGAAA